MTYKELVQSQYNITEKEYNALVIESIEAYQRAYDETRIRLKNIHAKILSGIPAEDYMNEMIKYRRLDALLEQIERAYRQAATQFGASVGRANQLAISNMYYRTIYAVQWGDNVPLIVPVLDNNLVNASVYGSTEAWSKIKDNIDKNGILPQGGTLSDILTKNRNTDLPKIRQEITAALIQGEGFQKTARRMRKFFNQSANNAIKVVRTDGNRNLNAGNYAAIQSMDVEIVRQWDATSDLKTRETHARADGQQSDKNDMFHVGDATGKYPCAMSTAKESVYCRCSVLSLPPGIEPETKRARDPVKEYQWQNATAAERKARQLKDGTHIYPRSEQTDIIQNTSFDDWMSINNLKFNNQGKIILAGG